MLSSCATHVEPQVRLSNALVGMVQRVDNPEADILLKVDKNASSTHENYVNATFDFLETLPAFNDMKGRLEFMNKHLIERDEYDDTRVDDLPDWYTDF